MLLTAFITALGRQDLGPEQPRVERYQTPAMLFWWGLVLLGVATAIRVLQRRRDYRSYVFIALQIVFLLVFVAEAGHYPELLAKNVSDGFMRSTAGLAVEAGIYDEAQIRSIFPWPTEVIPAYNFMRHAGMMTPPFKEYYDIGKKLGSVFSILPAGSCLGSTDLIHQVGLHETGKQDLFAAGWGYDPALKKAFKRVLAVTPGETIVGIGVSGIRRPEIAAAHPGFYRVYGMAFVRCLRSTGKSVAGLRNTARHESGVSFAGNPEHAGAIATASAAGPFFDIRRVDRLYRDCEPCCCCGLKRCESPDACRSGRQSCHRGMGALGRWPEHDGSVGVYPGGHVAGVPVARSDVVDAFKKGTLLMCGYRITITAGTSGARLTIHTDRRRTER